MSDLHGNTSGLKSSQVKAIKSLYDRRTAQGSFLTPELARRMTEISRETSRQIGLVVDRMGYVRHVVVGDAHKVFLPDLGRSRAGSGRFRGQRLIVTHLRGEGVSKDNLTDLTLLALDAVIVVQAQLDGLPGAVEWAHILPPEEVRPGEDIWRVESRPSVHHWTDDFNAWITELEARFTKSDKLKKVDGRTKAVLIGVTKSRSNEARKSLEELERLADTAGLQVVDAMLQVRKKADNRTLIGKGKLEDALLRCMHLGAEVLVFDRELAPSQLRNIATATELSVLDRTQLILDIFAQRATTKEGKLQVELAQLRYRKPRLAIMATAMSRLTGGIGGRGPGETKLELNRRRADERLNRISKELKKLGKHRGMRRDRRKRVGLPLVSIVGYTNAGKSTLLNRMTKSKVEARDALFATLDPTSRRLRFPEEREVILTDTVGFIRDLPKELVEAFRSTLEEVVEADLLLHLVDASSDEQDRHIASVNDVLKRLGAGDTPVLLIFNKSDAATPERLAELAIEHPGSLACSAVTGDGLDAVLDRVEQTIWREQARAAR
ncbi:MAG: GTPase HflX [Proteobacteria bacterium]|nr:GTPase HflX [Pseudomonadota bacterium]MCP4921775.1 GTPase HflX [Pseudomonadota bacterium]